jgi:signal transduction histidine kinase
MVVSLRQRIFWWSGASTLAILMVAFLVVNELFHTTILRDQQENLVSGTKLVAQLQRSEVDASLDRTASVAGTPTLRAAIETGDSITIRQNLEQILLDETGLSWLAVTTPDGELVASAGPAPTRRLIEKAAMSLAEEAQYYDTGDLWYEGGELVQVHAAGVFFDASFLGVVLGGTPIGAPLVSRLESATQQRIAILVDGTVVAGGASLNEREQEDLLGLWSAEQPDASQLTATSTLPEAELVRELTLAGDRFLAAALPLPDARGGRVGILVAFRSLEDAMQPARHLRLALFGIGLVGILLAFASSYALSGRVTRPVNWLLLETVRLGSGDLDHPIQPERDDEIGRLARGFEQMRISLRDARRELVRAERLSAVGRAASAIVHDFKQPVTVIQGHVEMLSLDGEDPVQRADDVEVIRNQLVRLTTMMGEILDFASGNETNNPTAGSVQELIEEVTGSIGPLLREREISLEVENVYTGDWRFDFPRIRRVLENLVRNATAATGPGGTVRLRSRTTDAGLRLVVEDTGPGIPEEVRDTLFEPFVTYGKKEGTGLGLAIVKAFTERQGGTVRFETSPAGTSFFLDFPHEDAA